MISIVEFCFLAWAIEYKQKEKLSLPSSASFSAGHMMQPATYSATKFQPFSAEPVSRSHFFSAKPEVVGLSSKFKWAAKEGGIRKGKF